MGGSNITTSFESYFLSPSKMMSSTEINVLPERQKIAKFRLQILVDNSKRFPKHTHLFKIGERMTELRCSKVGKVLNSKIDIMAYGIR